MDYCWSSEEENFSWARERFDWEILFCKSIKLGVIYYCFKSDRWNVNSDKKCSTFEYFCEAIVNTKREYNFVPYIEDKVINWIVNWFDF